MKASFCLRGVHLRVRVRFCVCSAQVLSHVAVFLSVFCGRVRFVFPHHIVLASSVLFSVAGQADRRQTKETESKQSRRCERTGNFIIQMQKHI